MLREGVSANAPPASGTFSILVCPPSLAALKQCIGVVPSEPDEDVIV